MIYLLFHNSLFALDVNECELGSDDCDENAQCMDTIGSFSCSCNFGYMGSGRECCKPTMSLSENMFTYYNITQHVLTAKFV